MYEIRPGLLPVRILYVNEDLSVAEESGSV